MSYLYNCLYYLMMTDWQRLEQVIWWANKNTNSFAKALGLNRTENLYQIKKGNNRISKSLAEKIVITYPNINKIWLLFGEGKMHSDDNLGPEDFFVGSIPFYDGDIFTILSTPIESLSEPIYRMVIPTVGRCDIAIRINISALEPKIQAGSILLLKKINPCDIMYGYKYILTTETTCALRIIKKGGTLISDSVILQMLNPESESRIDKTDIKNLYLVVGSIAMQ